MAARTPGRVNRNTLFEVVAGVRFLARPELDLHLDGVLTPCKTALSNKENLNDVVKPRQ